MAAVHRSTRAEFDLLEIWEYIAREDSSAADRLLDRIEGACELLAQSPRAGPSREDLAPGLRFYPVGNYLIFYKVGELGVIVARVLHGARDYLSEFD